MGWRSAIALLLRRVITLALVLLLAIVLTTAVLVVWGTTVMRHDDSRCDDGRGGLKAEEW